MTALPDAIRVFERGWLSSNNVLLVGADDTALIDSGYLTHAPQTLALVRHGLQGRRLDRLLNTHLHSDHCGGNAALQAHYGCHTSIPAAEADKVRRWDSEALSFKATGQQCERFGFDATIAPGELLTLGGLAWQALGAPGHDPHSLIFYCPAERILISADALWENGFGIIFPELDGASGFAETRATLELIGGLDVRLVIPGHGAPFGDVAGALRRAHSRLDYLMADPLRNAQNAIKVLLKFLLLERQSIALADVPALLTAMPVFDAANRRFLRQGPEALGQWAVEQLLRAGAARVEGEHLLNEA
ncbi:MBL fold metallo-hydrolase [Janthinobacterium fluminis]|uniref:beta-lactamase n=1 Tax=Janthinobacterium fluminis TaxID=2987524 RepID=A0ABT5JZY2_9BURK|nr:MBL fold metallo-hydrolase [Janthinobacterium fluminis]MDC8757765.1 MBL fold metallo-hydrolase [Janthinobacterium fluminis]